MLQSVKGWAGRITVDVHAVYLAGRDPRVAWYAKALAVLVAAYALSPIDLIPDFIPVLGYLDDLILVPLGIMLVIKLIPPGIMAEHRAAAAMAEIRPGGRIGAIAVIGTWIVAAGLLLWLLWPGPARAER